MCIFYSSPQMEAVMNWGISNGLIYTKTLAELGRGNYLALKELAKEYAPELLNIPMLATSQM